MFSSTFRLLFRIPAPAVGLLATVGLLLSGCDQMKQMANQPTVGAQAVGAACRQIERSLEDCYQQNPGVSPADIFDGWRAMNEYITMSVWRGRPVGEVQVPPPPPPPENMELCQKITENDASRLYERWANMVRAGDTGKVLDLYTDNATITSVDSEKLIQDKDGKRAYFDAWLQKKPIGRVDERTMTIGCNLIVESGLETFTIADDSNVHFRYTNVYQWTPKAENWLILVQHTSAMPEKKDDKNKAPGAPAK